MPVILDWRQAAAPDELTRQAAEAIAAGATAILPSEIGFILAAAPERLSNPSRPGGLPEALSLRRLEGYFDADALLTRISASPAERVLAARIWPGPIGWIHDECPYPAWVPSHQALASVLAKFPQPLALFEKQDGSPIDPATLGEGVAIVLDDGGTRSGPLTLLRPNDSRWEIVRQGALSADAIRTALARRIVFVCTGNTCRSPMAEGLFKQRLAERLGCGIDALLAQGFSIGSAGIMATPGDPATTESAAAVLQYGVDLAAHRSRPATAELIARADDVIAMTRSHLLTLVNRYPVLAGALRLISGAEGDLDDPIGRGPEVYQACAATVRVHVDRLITEMGLT